MARYPFGVGNKKAPLRGLEGAGYFGGSSDLQTVLHSPSIT